jgi:hypothetical protein
MRFAMSTTVYGLSCFVVVIGVSSVASADPDYYHAFASAEAAVKAGDCPLAIDAIETALRKYPHDYALTLKLAWVEFQCEDFEAAERVYRIASDLSDQAIEPRVGMGWALIQQERCEEGTRVLRAVLAEAADAAGAQRGIDACAERERIHGSIWGGVGGSLYQGHPWMHESGAGSLGFDLLPGGNLEFGAVYRFLALKATDPRVPGFTQHEIYAQAGYVSPTLDILGHGALIWSGDAVVGGSRHLGASLRRKYAGAFPGDVFIEVSGSYYQDLWVARIAPAWTVALSPVALTASVAVERFAHEILGGASLTASLALGSLSCWVNAKVGPEYRAAYLSQFGVLNAEDRGLWGASAGARWRVDEHWALFVSYTLLRLRTSDGLLSELHNVNIGTVFTL